MAANHHHNLQIFKEPQCLIDTGRDGKLQVQSSLISELESLEKPLVVIAIAGLYRTGKSYLMNRLAGKMDGFALGSTIQSETKGIWIWVTEHPRFQDRYLVLLDTEGLGDAEKGDQNHDNWIFTLATLLSSTLVYNGMGTINEDALAKLNFVTEMSKHIKIKSSHMQGDDADFDCHFPLFIFVVRDFTLELVLYGVEVTSDQYLEHCLALRSETTEALKRFNRPRMCIRKYFKNRKCFTLDRPANKQQLKHLESLSDSDLSPDFVKEVNEFLHFALANCPVKKLDTGKELNGRMFSVLVTTYVEAIRNGVVPCVESAIKSLARIENIKAVEAAIQVYNKEMETGVKLPTKDDKTLNDHHFKSLQKSVAHFLDRAVMDENNQFQKELNVHIEERFKHFIRANSDTSFRKCQALLAQLEETILTKLKNGNYAKNGGFVEFQRDLQEVQRRYKSHTDLGVQKNEALLAYMQDKQKDSDTVLAADQQVTAEERRTEEERQKALEADRQKQSAEREAELTKQYAEEKERSLQENIKQMQESNEKQLKAMQDHHDKVMNDRINEQRRLLEEGFRREADQLRGEMDRMRDMYSSGGGDGCTIL